MLKAAQGFVSGLAAAALLIIMHAVGVVLGVADPAQFALDIILMLTCAYTLHCIIWRKP